MDERLFALEKMFDNVVVDGTFLEDTSESSESIKISSSSSESSISIENSSESSSDIEIVYKEIDMSKFLHSNVVKKKDIVVSVKRSKIFKA